MTKNGRKVARKYSTPVSGSRNRSRSSLSLKISARPDNGLQLLDLSSLLPLRVLKPARRTIISWRNFCSDWVSGMLHNRWSDAQGMNPMPLAPHSPSLSCSAQSGSSVLLALPLHPPTRIGSSLKEHRPQSETQVLPEMGARLESG